jgi:AcrR family transcriptional regulator
VPTLYTSRCCQCQHLLLYNRSMTEKKPKPYHHGNLREELLKAALILIAKVGPMAFTLREVARQAGVSHNAPYRHFLDKDALLAAVREEGFRDLNRAMQTVAVKRQPTALDRLKAAGLAYVSFALRRPEHFAVMFDVPVPTSNSPERRGAQKEAFETLVRLVGDCQEAGQMPSGESIDFALLAWTMVHGIAKLATTRRLPYRSGAEILRFSEFVIDQSLPRL